MTKAPVFELSEESFRKIFETTSDAAVIINREGKIDFVNTRTERVFGYLQSELLGQPIEILIPEHYRDVHIKHRANYFDSPSIRAMGAGMKLFGLRKNGNKFPVEISLCPLETKSGPIALALIRDITDRVLIEEALQEKNDELEKAKLAKDSFLASMSHELRTPLNAIIGFTGTLLMRLPGPLNKDQEKQLTTIKGSARHLLSLINDLLDLAKIESGKVTLSPEKVECQSIIKETIGTLATLAESKGLKLNVLAPHELIFVNTDRRALTQILINLANNAIKFTDKGKIDIRLDKQDVDGKKYVVIDVIDTGIGIKPEDKTKLFQAFQQMSVTGKRAEGTGLGLHLSQILAKLISGKIEFESEYGKGSRFSILLSDD